MMRYSTKKNFLSGTALIATGFLATAALAQDSDDCLFADEFGATSYNPITSSNLNSAASLIYDRLVEQDADQSYHPHLATSWEESPDGMSWTFKLKDGVKFHDGTPFSAQSVADWIPDFAETDNAYLVGAVESVEVVDELTVRCVMSRPDPSMLYNLSSTFMGIPGTAS